MYMDLYIIKFNGPVSVFGKSNLLDHSFLLGILSFLDLTKIPLSWFPSFPIGC